MIHFSGRRRAAAVLAAAAVVLSLRIAYDAEYATDLPFVTSPVVDAEVYDLWARDIASGNWIGDGVFYRAPLYPYALATVYAVGGGRIGMIFLQVLLGLLGMGILYRAGSRLLSPAAAALGVFLYALYAPPAFFETKLLPTTLGLFLHVATLLALASAWDRRTGRSLFIAGLLAGAYALARPTGLLFLAVAAGAWLVLARGEERLRPSGWIWLGLGVALVIAPVTVRNAVVGGDLVLISSNGGMTFYHGNHEENRSGLMAIPGRLQSNASALRQEEIDRLTAERETGSKLKPSERSRYWFLEGLRFWKENPRHGLALVGLKLVKALGPHEFSNNYSLALEREKLVSIRFFFVRFTLLAALGGLGFLWLPRTGAARILLPAGVIAGLLVNVVFFVTSRYRLEMAPSLSLLAGWALAEGFRRIRAGRFKPAQLAVPALLIVPAFVPPGAGRDSQECIMWVQLGLAHEAQAHERDAEAAFRRAHEIYPPSPFACGHLALALAARGEGREARAVIEPMLSAPQVHPFVFYAAGVAREADGDLRGAEAALKEALRRAPGMTSAHRALLRVLLREDKQDDVRAFWRPPAIPREWGAERSDRILARVLEWDGAGRDSLAEPNLTAAEKELLKEILPDP